EESLPGNEVAVRIEAFRFLLDAVRLERLPLAADPHTPQVQHGLRPRLRPVHARPLHAVLDQVPAGSFDYPAGDRIALPEIHVVAHPLPVLMEVAADTAQRFLL